MLNLYNNGVFEGFRTILTGMQEAQDLHLRAIVQTVDV